MDAVSLSDPQTLNLYAYCGNDPINNLDPDGLFWGAIGRFFKAVGRAIATFFGSGMGGFSGPDFRTPPTFPGSLPGINAARRSGLESFRTPPFVSGFLHTSSIAIWEVGVGAVGMFLQMMLVAISAAQGGTGELPGKETGKKVVDNAVSKALKALRNSKCRDVIKGPAKKGGNDPAGTLREIDRRTNVKLGEGSNAKLGAGRNATISLDKVLFNHKSLPLTMGISDITEDMATAQAVEVLHELSHATGRYSHFGYKKGVEQIGPMELNRRILGACFGKK